MIALAMAAWLAWSPEPAVQNRKTLEAMVEIRLSESVEAGQILARIAKDGPTVGLWNALARDFTTQAKPVQAIYCHNQALGLDPKNEEALAGVQKAKDKLVFLKKQAERYREKAGADNLSGYCSQAAIVFHLGKPKIALDILSRAIGEHGQDSELVGLQNTFQQGLLIDRAAMEFLFKGFNEGLKEKNFEDALTNLSRIYFLSLGMLKTEPLIDKLIRAFPEKLDKSRLMQTLKPLTDLKS